MIDENKLLKDLDLYINRSSPDEFTVRTDLTIGEIRYLIKNQSKISVDKILKRIEENCYPVIQLHNSIEKGMTLAGIRQCFEKETSSNDESVLYGEWVEIAETITLDTVYMCSECGEKFVFKQNLYKHCPNCGAKMTEEGKENE